MDPEQQFLLFGITPEVFTPKQARLANDLFSAGLDYLYIRSGEADAVGWHERLSRIDPAFYSRLLLPGNAPAGIAAGKYIRHIRERERTNAMGEEGCLGVARSTSVHHLGGVPQLAARYRYLFFSPLFPSISKPGYGTRPEIRIVEKQLADLRLMTTLPRIIGLGGIHAGNIAQVKAAGFHGAALLGALWQRECPLQALAEIKQAV